MEKKGMKKVVARLEKAVTLENVLLFYGGAAGVLFTYALSLLAGGAPFGGFEALEETIAAVTESGVALGFIGLAGGLLLDLLKKEKAKEKEQEKE